MINDTCTPVRVFFGTNRNVSKPEPELHFGTRNAYTLQLGRAIVTVPRGTDRPAGQVTAPTWVDTWIRGVPPEGDPSRHFVIVRKGMQIFSNEGDFLDAVRQHMEEAAFKDHAFVFVHGYRVSFDDALKRTAQLAYDLGAPDAIRLASSPVVPREGHAPFGTAFLYSWPSQESVLGYASDIERARSSVDHLETFLELVIQQTQAKKVHLIAHSMGNVALMRALDRYALKHGTSVGKTKIQQLVLAAPDMAPREFVQLAQTIRPLSVGMTLYASANDGALTISREVHDEPRVGDVIDGVPTVVPGVDTIDISEITDCYFCWGHDEYVEQPVLLNDIAALLRTGTRPPDRRTRTLSPSGDEDLRFWRYLKAAATNVGRTVAPR